MEKHRRLQKSELHPRFDDRCFDRRFGDVVRHRADDRVNQRRKDDAAHARVLGGFHQTFADFGFVRNGKGREVENRVRAFASQVDAGPVTQVADGDFGCAVFANLVGLFGIADQGAHLGAAFGEFGHDQTRERACGTDSENSWIGIHHGC